MSFLREPPVPARPSFPRVNSGIYHDHNAVFLHDRYAFQLQLLPFAELHPRHGHCLQFPANKMPDPVIRPQACFRCLQSIRGALPYCPCFQGLMHNKPVDQVFHDGRGLRFHEVSVAAALVDPGVGPIPVHDHGSPVCRRYQGW